MVSHLELTFCITAAQRYERHFERLPHRIQVVLNHLLDKEPVTYEISGRKQLLLEVKREYDDFTSVLCTSCSDRSSLIRYISRKGSDLLKISCRGNKMSKPLTLNESSSPKPNENTYIQFNTVGLT